MIVKIDNSNTESISNVNNDDDSYDNLWRERYKV